MRTHRLPHGNYLLAGLATLFCAIGASVTTSPAGAADPIQVSSISAGAGYTCGIRTSGQAACWGLDLLGELGNGIETDTPFPNPTNVTGLADAKEISAGFEHACAIRISGQAVCWGGDELGTLPLGDGAETETTRLTPTNVSGLTDAKQISAGDGFSCAIRTSGQAVCWGYNTDGQLGDGTETKRLTPTNVSGVSDAVAISAGADHACAIRISGQAVCWGNNWKGQIGDGTDGFDDYPNDLVSLTPTNVSGLTDAVAISAGLEDSCAIRTSGQAVCWGITESGKLGIGAYALPSVDVPTNVSGLTDATSISAGSISTCAIRTSGQAVCWGDNYGGEVGDGTTGNERPVPTDVSGLTDAKGISVGWGQACAVRTSGEAVCWGYDYGGQLGIGTATEGGVLTPMPVVEGGSGSAPVETCATNPALCPPSSSEVPSGGSAGTQTPPPGGPSPAPVPAKTESLIVCAGVGDPAPRIPAAYLVTRLLSGQSGCGGDNSREYNAVKLEYVVNGTEACEPHNQSKRIPDRFKLKVPPGFVAVAELHKSGCGPDLSGLGFNAIKLIQPTNGTDVCVGGNVDPGIPVPFVVTRFLHKGGCGNDWSGFDYNALEIDQAADGMDACAGNGITPGIPGSFVVTRFLHKGGCGNNRYGFDYNALEIRQAADGTRVCVGNGITPGIPGSFVVMEKVTIDGCGSSNRGYNALVINSR